MLHDRQEFHVRESHATDIFGQLGGQFAVGCRRCPPSGRRIHDPRCTSYTEMGPSTALLPATVLHPLLVIPRVIQRPDVRCRLGGALCRRRKDRSCRTWYALYWDSM